MISSVRVRHHSRERQRERVQGTDADSILLSWDGDGVAWEAGLETGD